MSNRSALRDRTSLSEDCQMKDLGQFGDCCRVVSESSIGSGWKRLTHVLAELEALHGSPPPHGLVHALNPP